MTDQHAVSNDPIRNLEPVHAEEPETHEARWTGRLPSLERKGTITASPDNSLTDWAGK